MLIELVTEEPALTEISPELEAEKLKVWFIVNEALASVLAFNPLLNAFALTTALLVRVMGPAYSVEDSVGVEPSTV